MKRQATLAQAALSALLLLPASLIPAWAQERPQVPGAGDEPVVRAISEAVLLDLVVRDRDGRPVRDLTADDIVVYENGQPQRVLSFSFSGASEAVVKTEANETAPTAERRAAPDEYASSLRLLNLVTLVFDNLALEAGNLAKRAAIDFVQKNAGDKTWIAVFNVSKRLIVLQEFTQDQEKLIAAIEAAVSQAPIKYYNLSDQIFARMQEEQRALGEVDSAIGAQGAGAGAAGARSGQAAQKAKLAELLVNMMMFSDTMEREASARSSLYSLLSLVQGQGSLEGRKTLVYFSGGMYVPPNIEQLFETVISESNRKNVSIYAVDARGLMSSGQMDRARDALSGAVESSMRQQRTSGAAVTREQATLTDMQDDITRMNLQAVLGDISSSTGGLLIANTNDFSTGMNQVQEDISYHYELAYLPAGIVYDGSLREIKVEVKRPGLQIQSRSGYFALPPTGKFPVLPFESPMLVALSSAALPSALPLAHSLVRFEATPGGYEHVLSLEMPLDKLLFEENMKTKQYEASFAMLALIRDQNGEIVEKFSQEYPVRGPIKNLNSVRQSQAVFIRRFLLRPGSYVLEAAAHDPSAAKMGGSKWTFEVPEIAAGVKLSSLIVVKRTEELEKDDDRDDPLRFQDLKVVPNTGEPILKVDGNKLVLYMVVYPDPDLKYEPKVGLEFSQSGQVIGATQPALPDRDERGRIPFFITFPLDYFKAGDFKVRAVVQQGVTFNEASALFSVRER